VKKTSLWALESSFEQKIKKEMDRYEKKCLQEAMDCIAELRAEELIDDGLAFYAGDY